MSSIARPLLAFFGILSLGALVNCAGGGSTGSGPPVDAPSYRVGDRWVYHVQDGFRVKNVWEETHEVTAIGADGITVQVTQKGPSTNVSRTELWAAPGQLKVGSIYDNQTRRFVTPMQAYDFPLASGKSWSQFVNNYNEFTKQNGQINRYVRVGGWDKVTTSAGSFDAISMQVIMHLDDETFWRFGTDCNYQVWYAPAIRGIVRQQKDAQYVEKGGDYGAGSGTIRTEYAQVELLSFTPGK